MTPAPPVAVGRERGVDERRDSMRVRLKTATSQGATASNRDARRGLLSQAGRVDCNARRLPRSVRAARGARRTDLASVRRRHRAIERGCRLRAATKPSSAVSAAGRTAVQTGHQASDRRARAGRPRPSQRRGRIRTALAAGTRPRVSGPGRTSKQDAPDPPTAADNPTDRAATRRTRQRPPPYLSRAGQVTGRRARLRRCCSSSRSAGSLA